MSYGEEFGIIFHTNKSYLIKTIKLSVYTYKFLFSNFGIFFTVTVFSKLVSGENCY